MKLTQAFYHRDTRLVAQALLGKYLVRFQDGLPLVVRIQETEAYIGRMDKACHAYNYRRTPRTETLFAPPGTAYIYLIYGMYHCLNFVTEPEGEPCAVLIRGGQPRGSLSFWPGTDMASAGSSCLPIRERIFSTGRANFARLWRSPGRRMAAPCWETVSLSATGWRISDSPRRLRICAPSPLWRGPASALTTQRRR